MRPCRLLLASLLLVGVGSPASKAVAGGPVSPTHDGFYRYSGRTPLSRVAPGTVLKRRSVHVAFGPTSTRVTAEQLLYRTTGERGQPTVTVTTVIAPAPSSLAPRVVEYLSFYDGLDARCDPSFTLTGGDPGGAAGQQAEEEELLLSYYLGNGFAVTVPDFEGTDLDWMAGRESGYNALDAIRATEAYLRFPVTTKVGLSGYSGGAVAADWASELAPAYAPELNVVGVAEGGLPVNYIHLFHYVNGTDEFSAAIPGMLVGLARADHIDLAKYLSPYGAKVVRLEQHTCIASDFGRFPGLTYQRLLKPAYRDLMRVKGLARMLTRQTMGTASTHPRAPLFMAVGNSDGKGDGVMDAADVRALAAHYCQQGVPVDYQEYKGAQHQYAGIYFEPQTAVFLQARFAGGTYLDNCQGINRPPQPA